MSVSTLIVICIFVTLSGVFLKCHAGDDYPFDKSAPRCITDNHMHQTTLKCFWATGTKTNYTESDEQCRLEGGVLATIYDDEQANLVKTALISRYDGDNEVGHWFGMVCDSKRSHKLTAENGDMVLWDQPCSGELPNKCQFMRTEGNISNLLEGTQCTKNKKALCESTNYTEATCKGTIDEKKSRCLWVTSKKSEHAGADGMCTGMDGKLAKTLPTGAKVFQDTLAQEYDDVWVGLVCRGGQWYEENGTDIVWPHWCPMHSKPGCGVLHPPVSVAPTQCSGNQFALCEIGDIFQTGMYKSTCVTVTESVTVTALVHSNSYPAGVTPTCTDNTESLRISSETTVIDSSPATHSFAITERPTCTNTTKTVTQNIVTDCYTEVSSTSTADEPKVFPSTSPAQQTNFVDSSYLSPVSSSTDMWNSASETTAPPTQSTNECANPTASSTLLPHELKQKIKQLEVALAVKKQDLSVTKRKRQCAHDGRASSISLGVVCWIIVIIPIVGALFIDLPRYYLHLNKGVALKGGKKKSRSVKVSRMRNNKDIGKKTPELEATGESACIRMRDL